MNLWQALPPTALLALLAMITCKPAAAETSPPEVLTRTPQDEFRAICAAYKASDNHFYGEQKLRRLQGQLAQTGDQPVANRALRMQLAWEQLKFGQAEDAVATLQGVEDTPAAGLNTAQRNALEGLLVLAHLQAAEDQNCLGNHNADSCLLPLRDGGIHIRPQHARLAGDLSLKILAREGFVAQVAWLANIARMASGDWPQGVPAQWRLAPDTFQVPEHGLARWVDVAPGLGVDSTDLAGGAVMDDFDGDGYLDLLSSSADPCASLRAFRNDQRGGFVDVTERWGLAAQLGGLNLIHGDYDNDGRLDLLVLRGGWLHAQGRVRNSLLRNTGEGSGGTPHFVDVTRAAGVAEPAFPTQTAAFADYDGDGDLDLYVGNEGSGATPYPSQLFRNDGDGHFTDVAAQMGVVNQRYTKGVTWGDYDNDGDPDLYVSTNNSANRLYRNDGERFTDVATSLGVQHPSTRSFATWYFDYNNDGWLDIFAANFENPPAQAMAWYFDRSLPLKGSVIYRNLGDGRFSDVSAQLNLHHPTLPMGANYGDLNNDGWLDIYLGTGEPAFESQLPNVMYINRAGAQFEEATYAGGFGHLQKGHGVAFGDLDNDGDQDLFHQLGGFFPGDAFGNALFANPSHDTRWVTLRLRGVKANRFAVGARVQLALRTSPGKDAPLRRVHALVGSGGSFGGSSLQQEIGLGDAQHIEWVQVQWPGSLQTQRYTGLKINRVYELTEGRTRPRRIKSPSFELRPDASSGHHHAKTSRP